MQNQLEVAFSKPDGDQAKKFTFFDKKPGGIHEGAIYTDENGERWLLKIEEPIYALKEVIASQLYRSIVGEDAAPEVQIIKQEPPKKWIVASKWCEGLEKFDERSEGIEKMIIASFIIGDGDCQPKNIGKKNNKMFRYDFGASLGRDGNEQKSHTESTSLFELISNVGLNPFETMDFIDLSRLQTELKRVDSINFDWSYWENLYNKALSNHQQKESTRQNSETPQDLERISLKKQREYVNDRFQTLINLRENLIEMPQVSLSQNLRELLIQFYTDLSYTVKPMIPNYVTTMVNKHLASLEETGEHPKFYNFLRQQANQKHSILEINKQFGFNLKQGSEEEIEFYKKVKSSGDLIEQEISNKNVQKPDFIEETVQKLDLQKIKSSIENGTHISVKDYLLSKHRNSFFAAIEVVSKYVHIEVDEQTSKIPEYNNS